MKNLLHLVCLAPLALAAAACGDDETGSGGGSTTSADAASSGDSSSTGTPSTTTGGEGGEGGGGGGAPLGEPIDAPDEEWTWVDFPTSRCIDDSPTGIGVNLSASNDEDVVIFLQGGNACFNTVTCFVTAHTDGFDADTFDQEIGEVGALELFTRGEQNPIGDWSWAYVPYCTGDVHAGDNAGVEVGGEERTFRGFRNMGDYLARLVPTFPNAKRVLLTGVSAGGFGAAYNYDQVKRAFGPDVDVYLVDDSGPPMAEEYVPACLQGRFKELWGLDNTLPEGCDACRAGDTFTEEFMAYEFEQFPDQRFAIISSTEDETIKSFWSFGNNDCASIEGGPGTYPEGKYEEGLIDLRDRVADGANFALFMPTDDEHVWLDDDLATTIGESPTLLDWVGQTISDDPAWHSWPDPNE